MRRDLLVFGFKSERSSTDSRQFRRLNDLCRALRTHRRFFPRLALAAGLAFVSLLSGLCRHTPRRPSQIGASGRPVPRASAQGLRCCFRSLFLLGTIVRATAAAPDAATLLYVSYSMSSPDHRPDRPDRPRPRAAVEPDPGVPPPASR
jgi:hypothetical protein